MIRVPRNNFVASAPPTVNDDTLIGYRAGFSRWLDTTTLVEYRLLIDTAGAAVWVPTVLFPGYRSGEYYPTFAGAGTSAAVAAADIIYVRLFPVYAKLVFTGFGPRVTTGAAGSSVKGAIYSVRPSGTGKARPFGPPVAVDNVGVSTTTSSATAETTAAGTLYPGIYASAIKFASSGGLPTVVTTLGTTRENEAMLGRTMPASSAGSQSLVGLSYAHSYALDFPTFDGTETWTDVLNATLPVTWLKLA